MCGCLAFLCSVGMTFHLPATPVSTAGNDTILGDAFGQNSGSQEKSPWDKLYVGEVKDAMDTQKKDFRTHIGEGTFLEV